MGRVVVVGSVNMDVLVRAERLPRTGETVYGDGVDMLPGGKGANQAVAARRAGAETLLVGALGDDAFAADLRAFLTAEGLGTDLVAEAGGPSGTALITVDGGGRNTIVMVPGANNAVDAAQASAVTLSPADVVLLQNEIPEETNVTVARRAAAAGARTVLNLAPYRPTSRELLDAVAVLVVNEHELAALTGEDGDMDADRVRALLRAGAGGPGDVVVTRGAEGLCARVDGELVEVGGHAVSVRDTTGAGDCFAGAFAAALVTGVAAGDALRFANAAAALSVQAVGAGPAMPRRDDILRLAPVR